MSEQKRAYREGADGKLYFTYNAGAVYELRPPYATPFSYRVQSCELDGETEYYRVESAGELLPARFSVTQLEFMLSRLPCKQLEEGEPVELPLLLEEVKAYFAVNRKEVNKANVEANNKLKGTAYYSNVAAIRALTEKLFLARSNGETEKAGELEKSLAEIEATQAKILDEKKIDLKVLTKAATCKLCGDSGIVDGKICACAQELADKIKTFNAAKRLARHG